MRQLMFVLLLLFGLSLPLNAQDVTTYTAATQVLNFDVPEGWIIQEEPNNLGYSLFIIADSQATLDAPPTSPDQAFIIMAHVSTDVIAGMDTDYCGTPGSGLPEFDAVTFALNAGPRMIFEEVTEGITLGPWETAPQLARLARADAELDGADVRGVAYAGQVSDTSGVVAVMFTAPDAPELSEFKLLDLVASARSPESILRDNIADLFDVTVETAIEDARPIAGALSPDGSQMAYIQTGGEWLCIDSDCNQLPEDMSGGGHVPVWSPDGSMIAMSALFAGSGGNGPQYVIDAATAEATVIAPGGEFIPSLPIFANAELEGDPLAYIPATSTLTTNQATVAEVVRRRPDGTATDDTREMDVVEITAADVDGETVTGWLVARDVDEETGMLSERALVRAGRGTGTQVTYTDTAWLDNTTLVAIRDVYDGDTHTTELVSITTDGTLAIITELLTGLEVAALAVSGDGAEVAMIAGLDTDDGYYTAGLYRVNTADGSQTYVVLPGLIGVTPVDIALLQRPIADGAGWSDNALAYTHDDEGLVVVALAGISRRGINMRQIAHIDRESGQISHLFNFPALFDEQFELRGPGYLEENNSLGWRLLMTFEPLALFMDEGHLYYVFGSGFCMKVAEIPLPPNSFAPPGVIGTLPPNIQLAPYTSGVLSIRTLRDGRAPIVTEDISIITIVPNE